MWEVLLPRPKLFFNILIQLIFIWTKSTIWILSILSNILYKLIHTLNFRTKYFSRSSLTSRLAVISTCLPLNIIEHTKINSLQLRTRANKKIVKYWGLNINIMGGIKNENPRSLCLWQCNLNFIIRILLLVLRFVFSRADLNSKKKYLLLLIRSNFFNSER